MLSQPRNINYRQRCAAIKRQIRHILAKHEHEITDGFKWYYGTKDLTNELTSLVETSIDSNGTNFS
jgi:hypothetical protein